VGKWKSNAGAPGAGKRFQAQTSPATTTIAVAATTTTIICSQTGTRWTSRERIMRILTRRKNDQKSHIRLKTGDGYLDKYPRDGKKFVQNAPVVSAGIARASGWTWPKGSHG
jgi:hypothetical protein